MIRVMFVGTKPMRERGMTLIDVLVGVALFLIVFMALFGLLRSSAQITSLAKARAGATAVGESQMEYIRGLTYVGIGTVGGIPSGTIPQVATTTDGGVTYVVHTFINYVDDPADGIGAADTNGITADYKSLRVEVDYTAAGGPRSVVFSSIAAPPGIESTLNGGTLSIRAVNSTGAPIPGAQVSIIDASVTPAVNISAFTDDAGVLSFPGAPIGTGYRIIVTDTGYSTAQTYDQNSQNVNPNPGHLTVSSNQTTTGTFSIDKLSTITLKSYSPIATSTFADTFSGTSNVATNVNTVVSGGAVSLAPNALSGTITSVATSSPYLANWGVVYATTTIPTGTTLKVQVVTQGGSLVPDTVLPGNSSGFASFPVSLYGVSTTTYPSLALSATLTSTATTTTPQLLDWSLSSAVGPVPLPNVGFTITGTKTIGSTGTGAAIYKNSLATSTGNTASTSLSLEWDSYNLTVPNYDIVDACTVPPYVIAPNTTNTESLTLVPATSNMILVSVQNSTGTPVSGASVTLSRTGYTATKASSACGNTYFGNLTSGTSYSLTVSATSYTTQTISSVSIAGATFYTVTLN